MKLLYLGANWPQPWITAAGLRTVDLIKSFKALGYQVEFLSIKKPNAFQIKAIKALEVPYGFVPANDEKVFKTLVKRPELCVFETARVEEMFSHLLYTHYPECLRILDTQDLHCLRLQRKELLRSGKSFEEVKNLQLNWRDELTCREFAGILRSHSTILTSTYEDEIVHKVFPYLSTAVLPFFYENKKIEKHMQLYKNNESRQNFVWIGNFTHEPNVDALEFTLKEIWPRIHEKLGCELHIYGAHCPSAEKYQVPGAVVKGTMGSLSELSKYKCLLAYLRFGAGVKGKITDSFYYGLPVLTTSIGAEGIEPFPGFIEDEVGSFIGKAIELYSSDEIFKHQQSAFELLIEKYSRSYNEKKLEDHLKTLKAHPIQNILFSETLRSSIYFSKYIEAKNRS